MKKYIFGLLLFLLPILTKAQFIVEGVLSKGVFKEASVFFEKISTPTSIHPSGMNTSVYIVYANGIKEEIYPYFLPYAEQFHFRNDTVSFIATIMTGERFYFLMSKNGTNKWKLINSGFVAGYDNLPQFFYNIKSVTIIDLYYIAIDINPQLNISNKLLYFNPSNSQVDQYEQINNTQIEDPKAIIIAINQRLYKLIESNYKIPKLR